MDMDKDLINHTDIKLLHYIIKNCSTDGIAVSVFYSPSSPANWARRGMVHTVTVIII